MFKDIKNKAIKTEKTKESNYTYKSDLIKVYLRNNTVIDWEMLPKGEHELTPDQYEQIKSFL